MMGTGFNVVRVAAIEPPPEGRSAWLIENLWGAGAVGVIGGAPKSCKSWLALEMAAAVASGRPCLGSFAVPAAGSVMVYMAEDAAHQVRERVEHLAAARGAIFETLPIDVIVEPSVRLDRVEDVARLRATLARLRPRLLVLDPYVRLQRVDENNATEVSAVLSTLRELSRVFEMAIALVHHTRKGAAGALGEGLRGSSDFHAWGDSNLYLRRRRDGIVLSVEHRAAASPPPITLALVDGEGPVRLEIRAMPAEASFPDRILRSLGHEPRRLADLRDALGVRKQSLLEALHDLEAAGRVARDGGGWVSTACR